MFVTAYVLRDRPRGFKTGLLFVIFSMAEMAVMVTFSYWLAANVLMGVDVPQLRSGMYIIFIPWSFVMSIVHYTIWLRPKGGA
jgi:hypothetical protein